MHSVIQPQSFHVNEIIDQFRQAMADVGIPYGGPIDADVGDIKRFRVDGDRKGSLNGWYILHSDGIPAGAFGSWKTGPEGINWCAKGAEQLSASERAELEARRMAIKARRDEAIKARRAEAADLANVIWDAANPCDDHHYLSGKGVKSFGLRSGRWTRVSDDGEVWLDVKDALLVPICRGKRIVSMQAISDSMRDKIDRNKDFLPGGEKRGCAFVIGKPSSDTDVIVICEGYATGASIHMATGYTVLVAFDAGNIGPVAGVARESKPLATLVIAADDDREAEQRHGRNAGITAAREAAGAHRAWLAIPQFSDLTGNPTDFNDLHAREGLDAVASQISAAIRPDVADPVCDEAGIIPEPANDNEEGQEIAQVAHEVDFISPLPHSNGKGKPLSTIENLSEICRRLRVTVRYNVISKEIEILIPNEGFSIDNQANASLAWLASACSRFSLPIGQLGDFLCYLADRNPFNPVAKWITSKPWDGRSRLIEFMSTIRAEGEEEDYTTATVLKEVMMRRWMISAVAASFEPAGISAHGVLVLQGPQYLGKTAWFKSLAPASMGVIQDGLILRPDDRDSVKQVVSYWMVELGELDATFRRSDIAQLKSFLTKQTDTLRRAYAKLESHYARRTIFFASVNPRQFLHDPTGNRRYWTISCAEINHQHKIDMQQVWAEVYETMYLKGEKWFLLPEELAMLNNHNKDFEVLDPIKERMQTRYGWSEPHTLWRWMTATDIMAELGFDRPTRSDVTQCGQLILELNGRMSKRSNGKNLSLVPPKLFQS